MGSLNDSNTKILANSVWGVNTWSPQCVSITASATSADWLNPLSQVSLVAGRIGWVAHAAATLLCSLCALSWVCLLTLACCMPAQPGR